MHWELDLRPITEPTDEEVAADKKAMGLRYRPHCSKCGRFAPLVREPYQDYFGEWEPGEVLCKKHGRQDASWPEF